MSSGDKLSTQTSLIIVICSKISPKFDGGPVTDSLPVYAIWPECMYVSYIPGFSMVPRPESRYLNWRCYGGDGL